MSTDDQRRGLGDLDRVGAWNEREAADVELARQAINVVIAANSSRIAAAGAAEAERLRVEQARYLTQRRTLMVTDREAAQQNLPQVPDTWPAGSPKANRDRRRRRGVPAVGALAPQHLRHADPADAHRHATDHPVAVFVAGQPGSGKTTVQSQVAAQLGLHDAVLLDADDFMVFHPDYYQLANQDDRNLVAVPRPRQSRWWSMAVKYVQQ